MKWLDALLAQDVLPDRLIAFGIRRLLVQRLAQEDVGDPVAQESKLLALVRQLAESPLAVHTDDANTQHYELPTEFFQQVLGHHLKYSSAYYPDGCESLDEAEAAMLQLTVERAQLVDGQDVLELGCGWGSLTLFMAEKFPCSRILAISNSATQKTHIDEQAAQRGLSNLEVRTADMRHLEISQRFDRVVSVEMFEHMRNYRLLLQRVASWMRDDGKLFVHIFCHRRLAYLFEAKDESDWMSRYFFTGGVMPSADLLGYFDDDLAIEEQWTVNGQHYEKTARAWLRNMDNQRQRLLPILRRVYGSQQARKWWVYWRVFFLSCAELFGNRQGNEWHVAHYLFARSSATRGQIGVWARHGDDLRVDSAGDHQQSRISDLSDDLLPEVAAGDPAAIQGCIDRYGALIWSLARRHSPSSADAEDAVQEIYLDLWQSAARFDARKASETTFIAMIARRRLIDRHRMTQRRPQTDGIDLVKERFVDPQQRQIEACADASLAARALATLAPQEQNVILLSTYQGMSHGQIAQHTGIPLGTVKTYIRRGLLKVRSLLEKNASSGEEVDA